MYMTKCDHRLWIYTGGNHLSSASVAPELIAQSASKSTPGEPDSPQRPPHEHTQVCYMVEDSFSLLSAADCKCVLSTSSHTSRSDIAVPSRLELHSGERDPSCVCNRSREHIILEEMLQSLLLFYTLPIGSRAWASRLLSYSWPWGLTVALKEHLALSHF